MLLCLKRSPSIPPSLPPSIHPSVTSPSLSTPTLPLSLSPSLLHSLLSSLLRVPSPSPPLQTHTSLVGISRASVISAHIRPLRRRLGACDASTVRRGSRFEAGTSETFKLDLNDWALGDCALSWALSSDGVKVCVRARAYLQKHTLRVHVHVRVSVCARASVCECVCMCVCACMCVCMYVCVPVLLAQLFGVRGLCNCRFPVSCSRVRSAFKWGHKHAHTYTRIHKLRYVISK